MKNFKELLKDVERDLLVNIMLGSKHGRLTQAQARKITKDFVSENYANYEDLFGKLYVLSNSYKEVRKVYVKYAPEYYKEKDDKVLKSMRNHMTNLNFESAINVAKGGSYAR